MERVISQNAPIPAGHYEQGWKHGGLVFVSGQLPIDAVSEAKCTGTAAEQAAVSLSNMKAVLEAAGTGVNRVLKVTVYVSDITIWDEVDAAYRLFFGEHKPARSIVPVRDLHHGFKVEMEAVAAV
jgi:2-iminobutanoate/2-iminopropanoate deaminase